jgi:hypothetical protein
MVALVELFRKALFTDPGLARRLPVVYALNSSVNHQARACDIGSLGASEIGYHPGDFLGRAVARQRIHLLKHCGKFAIVRVQFRIHRTGLHIVNRYSARSRASPWTNPRSADLLIA